MSASYNQVAMSVAMYSLASGSMLVMNKVVLHFIPMPSLVTSIQFIFATVVCLVMKYSKYAIVDNYQWVYVQPYLLYIFAFVTGIYCNMRVLENANVETVIVFRTCSPLVVSLLDYFFLGRELPSKRSLAGLALIVAGAVGYVETDKEFQLNGWGAYTWVFVYLIIICFEMSYGKYIIKEVKMENKVLGAVYYTNSLAIIPMLALGFGVFGEGSKLGSFQFDILGLLSLAVSCAIGTCISYTAFHCRNLVSATSFTVIGVLNKMLTVLINTVIWDQHASFLGILSLSVCIGGGALYEQAPMRGEGVKKAAFDKRDVEAVEEIEPMMRAVRGDSDDDKKASPPRLTTK